MVLNVPSENEVDGEGFLLLTEEDFCAMIKPLGSRTKLIKIQSLLNPEVCHNKVNSSQETEHSYLLIIMIHT